MKLEVLEEDARARTSATATLTVPRQSATVARLRLRLQQSRPKAAQDDSNKVINKVVNKVVHKVVNKVSARHPPDTRRGCRLLASSSGFLRNGCVQMETRQRLR